MAGDRKKRLLAGGAAGARFYSVISLIPAYILSTALGLDGPGEYWYTLAIGLALAIPVYLLLRRGDRRQASQRAEGAPEA